jgi:hypothetical protein
MAKPRVYKRPHVEDPKLKKTLQQIDDEFSNVYAAIPSAFGNVDGGRPDSDYTSTIDIDGGTV